MHHDRHAAGINWSGARYLLRWALLALVLHGLWEAGHLPLYTLWGDPDRRRVMMYLLHCIAGDVLIAAAQFLLASALFRSFAWPLRSPWRGAVIITVLGVGFTAWSEWYSVYQAQSWSYSASMPLVFGVGLTPLLQWLVVPILMIYLFRRRLII